MSVKAPFLLVPLGGVILFQLARVGLEEQMVNVVASRKAQIQTIISLNHLAATSLEPGIHLLIVFMSILEVLALVVGAIRWGHDLHRATTNCSVTISLMKFWYQMYLQVSTL